jgi:hypothetical protein
MPTIEVFLMFDPKARNTNTVTDPDTNKNKTTLDKGPNWKSIVGIASNYGCTLKIHGPPYNPTVQEIHNSMQNAEVTLLVGHGDNPASSGSKWISDQIILNDGMIRSSDGILTGQWNTSHNNLANKKLV